MIFKKLLKLLDLARYKISFLSVSVPIMGALTITKSITISDFLTLGFIGFFCHLFGFSLNDIFDLEIDRKAPQRQNSPLVLGEIKLYEVWIFCIIQIPILILLYSINFYSNGIGLLCLIVSIILAFLYNYWSKHRSTSKLIAEVCLATSIGVLCMSGAASQSNYIPLRTIIFSSALTLLLLLLNSVPSGLKDLKTDLDSGARSFIIESGCTMLDEDKISIPNKVFFYVFFLQFLILINIIYLILLFHPPIILGFISIGLTIYSTLHLRMVLAIKSFQDLRKSNILLNGFYNYYSVALLVTLNMPVSLRILYYISIAYYILLPCLKAIKIYRQGYFLR